MNLLLDQNLLLSPGVRNSKAERVLGSPNSGRREVKIVIDAMKLQAFYFTLFFFIFSDKRLKKKTQTKTTTDRFAI